MKNIVKSTFLLLVLFCAFTVQAQFSRIDEHARSAPKHLRYDIDKLTAYLVQVSQNELEKTRAFYVWLTNNIKYDIQEYQDIISGRSGEIIYTENFKEYDKTIMKKAMQNGKGVCQAYALIFEEMCNIEGIENFLITGFSKNTEGESSNIGDHAWNVAFVDGKWRLYDATWGAGNVINRNYFEKEFNETYFDTAPETMILNHLPADPIWQLLPNPIKYETFVKDKKTVQNILKKPQNTRFAFNDSIQKLLSFPANIRPLISAENAYSFNPKNAEDLGYAWNNFAVQLSNKSISLSAANKSMDEILEANEQAIQAQKKAVFYTNDDRLLEGLGIFYLNQAKFYQDKGYNNAQSNNYSAALESYEASLICLEEARPIFGNKKEMLEAEGTSELNIGFVYSSMANDRINRKANFEKATFHLNKAKKLLSKAGTGLAKQNLRIVEQNLRAIEHNQRNFGL